MQIVFEWIYSVKMLKYSTECKFDWHGTVHPTAPNEILGTVQTKRHVMGKYVGNSVGKQRGFEVAFAFS